jgi:ferredoxin
MADELTIDRDRCMGSGQCTFYAPNTFDLDDLSIAIVTDQHGDSEDKVQMAIDVCPTRSIARAAHGGAQNGETQ